MNALIKFVMFLIAAGVLPVLSGLLPVSLLPAGKRRFPLIVLGGYLSVFALFEWIGLPVLIWTASGDFSLLLRLFLCADLIWIAAGILRCRKTGGIRLPEILRERKIQDADAAFCWLIFAALLGFELVMSYTHASFDGDDAYYVAQTLQTWQTGTMYYYVPYTGFTTVLDGRHAMAMMPMWIAGVAKLCGTHSTIVTHSMMPLVLIPLTDIAFYQAAVELTRGQKPERRSYQLPAMMVIVTVLQIFGNTSIYTPETFLLMRTWQGKSLFANFIFPLVFLLLFRIVRDAEDEKMWCFFMLVLLNLAAGFCTSLAPVLVTGVLLLASVMIAILRKRRWLPLAVLLTCIPCMLYLVLLLRMMYPGAVWFLRGGRLP